MPVAQNWRECLDDPALTPPAPWQSFPQLDPSGLGSLQGDFEQYWHFCWWPFWSRLSKPRQQVYLLRNAAPAAWVEYLACIETHGQPAPELTALPEHWRADSPVTSRQLRRWVLPVVVHLFAVATYIALNGTLVGWYKQYAGGLTARGVSIGIAMYLVFWFFAGMNLLIALLPRVWNKVQATVFMVAIIGFYLMPEHPLRALFYTALSGGVSLLAIGVDAQLQRYFLNLTLKGSK